MEGNLQKMCEALEKVRRASETNNRRKQCRTR